jgi:multidrug efflux system outer membrane protein
MREMLRALAGAGADGLPAIAPVPLPAGSGQLPATLGYELLARRPDLQAMRWYVQASFDQTEAAKAAFYPSFDIKAFAGFDALHLGDLFHMGSRQLNLIPGLTLPIFDSGRLNANLASSRARSNVLIAQYNEAVLNAVREVAQASLQMNSTVQQTALQEKKLKAAQFAFDSADGHYRRGLVDKVSAKEAKLPVLQEIGKALELRGAEIHAEVALTAALGGGYGMDSAAGPASTGR